MTKAFGESEHFDPDGALWEAKLTSREAIRMIRVLVRGLPALRAKGGFHVEINRRLKIAGYTELVIEHPEKRIVAVNKMVLAPEALNEHVVIHELAHIAAGTVHGDLKDPNCGHGLKFRTWCSIIKEYWLEIKGRA